MHDTSEQINWFSCFDFTSKTANLIFHNKFDKNPLTSGILFDLCEPQLFHL